jgi:hypothetical protein
LVLTLALIAAVAASVAGADELPTLLPGVSVVVKGTHVSCSVASSSVSCSKSGGLTATLGQTGIVRVSRTSSKPVSSGKPRQLSINGGFILAGGQTYCHVYKTDAPTMTCSLTVPMGGVANSHGFDINDRSVVVFRYDGAHTRHDGKTYSQPG